MKKYVKPMIEILIFDGEDITTTSGVENTAAVAVTKRNDALVDVNISIPTIISVD